VPIACSEILHAGTELTPVALDSLHNLPLTSSLRSEVLEEVLSRLSRYPAAYLPNIVQFVLNKVSNLDMATVVSALRNNLFFSRQEIRTGQQSGQGKDVPDGQSFIIKTFENVKHALMASKALTDAWMKAVALISVPDDFK